MTSRAKIAAPGLCRTSSRALATTTLRDTLIAIRLRFPNASSTLALTTRTVPAGLTHDRLPSSVRHRRLAAAAGASHAFQGHRVDRYRYGRSGLSHHITRRRPDGARTRGLKAWRRQAARYPFADEPRGDANNGAPAHAGAIPNGGWSASARRTRCRRRDAGALSEERPVASACRQRAV